VVVDAIIEVAAMGERDHDRLCEVRGNGGMSSGGAASRGMASTAAA
jgi:hypothetical protein